MAGRRKDLDDIRDIINRLRLGHPLKRIVRETGVSRKTLRRYQRLARHEGWLGGELPELAVLEAGLKKAPAPERRQISKAEVHRAVIEALLLKGVEAKAITGILRDHHGFVGSYSSVQLREGVEGLHADGGGAHRGSGGGAGPGGLRGRSAAGG